MAGNYGKAVEVGRSKKSQSREELRRSREDLTEETHGLLESEDELDREEMMNPEPENRSVSSAMRPQPTEYDRYTVKKIIQQVISLNLLKKKHVFNHNSEIILKVTQLHKLLPV